MTGTVTPLRPSIRLTPPPAPDEPRRWTWVLPALVLLSGCLIVCHGCHGGDHDADDELAVLVPEQR